MTRAQKYGNMEIRTKCFTPQNSPFNPTFYQKVMSCDETIDYIMKFRYSLIINDPQIDANTSHLAIN
jgi:hypothetical protein